MTKYTTKKINYTGCNPIIAEHLQRGEAILCRVDDGEGLEKKDYVTHYEYEPGKGFNYATTEGWWQNAEPIPQPQRRLKKASEIIAECERRGWTVKHTNTFHETYWASDEGRQAIHAHALADCGKTESIYNWPEWAWEDGCE